LCDSVVAAVCPSPDFDMAIAVGDRGAMRWVKSAALADRGEREIGGDENENEGEKAQRYTLMTESKRVW
jgi:hypothetical protein